MNGKPFQLFNDDCLNTLKTLPDNSVDLIVTDPPYFRVKKDAWDNQWPNVEAFLSWLDNVSAECWRVLKPSGTLYLFCGSALASDTEILLRQRFNVLNHIIWAKPSGPWRRTKKEDLRSFFPATERILMCEHYGSEGFAKGSSLYHNKCVDLKKQVFAPLIEYFKQAKEKAGISNTQINELTRTQMAGHWFSYSQWKLPNSEQYALLQSLFNQHLPDSHETLVNQCMGLNQEYNGLLRQYDDLKAEYQALRRPFRVTRDVPYTDVWHFKPVEHYPGKHPCEKPQALLRHIIESSSREGDLILDCFMGSGSTGKAALALNRRFIGIEFDPEIFKQTNEQIIRASEIPY